MSETYFKAIRPDGTSFHDPAFRWLPEDGVIPEGGWLVEHPNPGRGVAGYLSAATVATDCTGMDWPCRLLVVKPVGKAWTPERDALSGKRASFAWRVLREVPAHLALGSQGEHIAALIERAGSLTAGEAESLNAARYAARDAARDAARYAARDATWYAARYAAWYAARDATWYAARNAARYAARYAARDAARYAARDAARYAARDAAGDAAWDAARDAAGDAARDAAGDAARDAAGDAAWHAARDAAYALLVRDLISTEHYDTLTLPWRRTIGPLHPDDPAVSA